jgi:hypothetical protein
MTELIRMLRQQYLEMLVQYTANNGIEFPDTDTVNRIWKENAQAAIDTISKDIREANEAFFCNGKANAMLRTIASVSIQSEGLRMAKLTVN